MTIALIANAAFAMAVAFATRVRRHGRAILQLLTLIALTAFVLQVAAAMLCLHDFGASAATLLATVGESKWHGYLPVLCA